jgi:hypothetical protein
MASNLATYLATFQKIGQFFPNHLVTLVLFNKFFFFGGGHFPGLFF